MFIKYFVFDWYDIFFYILRKSSGWQILKKKIFTYACVTTIWSESCLAEKIIEEPRGSFPKTTSIFYRNKIAFISVWKMLPFVTLKQISLVVSSLQALVCMNNYKKNLETHIKRLNVMHNIQNSYMFQCRSTIYRESKIQSRVITNKTFLVLQFKKFEKSWNCKIRFEVNKFETLQHFLTLLTVTPRTLCWSLQNSVLHIACRWRTCADACMNFIHYVRYFAVAQLVEALRYKP